MTPLDFPGTGASQQEFELQRVDYSAPEAGGYVGGVQAGFPLWMATWTIGKIGAARSDTWRAWLMRMRGATRRFYGADQARPYPKAHIDGFTGLTRAGGGSFAGDATSWSEAINAEEDSHVTLNGLPAGMVLSTGDYIGFKWDGDGDDEGSYHRRALVRVVVGATANGSGVVTVTSEPPVSTAVPDGAVAHLDNPKCVMALITSQTKLQAIDRRLAIQGGTIAAVQDLRP